jgi:hypothetical protein
LTSRIRIVAVTLLTVAASWLVVPATPAQAVTAPCLIPGPQSAGCAGAVTFTNYLLSSAFRPFQGAAGTGPQPDITVRFSGGVVNRIRITANDPDFGGTKALVHHVDRSVTTLDFPADNQPGYFTAVQRSVNSGKYDSLVLQSNNSDYVNWNVEYQNDGSASWCRITVYSSWCQGVTATVSPFVVNSVFDPFQSHPDGWTQAPITITFEIPQLTVAATAVDPDFFGSQLEAYDAAGALLGIDTFPGDFTPGLSSVSRASVTDARGIARIRLVPAPDDYVAFQGLTVIGP